MTARALPLIFLLAAVIGLGLESPLPGLTEARSEAVLALGQTDIGLVLAHLFGKLGVAPGTALVATSFLGAAFAPGVLLFSTHHRRFAALAFHPAFLLLAVTGYGAAASGLLLFMVSLGRLAETDEPGHVPLLAFALVGLAASLPSFELLALAAVAPLFLVAPSAMAERHMTVFYVVVLMPMICFLGLKAAFGGLGSLSSGGSEPGLLEAGLPVAIGLPMLALLLPAQRRWRLVLPLLTLAAGIVLSASGSPILAGLLISLMAAFALRTMRAPLMEAAAAFGFMLAAIAA
jgi:hypothetical protein